MPAQKISPRIDFENTTPQYLLYSIIGHGELCTVRLPATSTPVSSFSHQLRLFLRLSWTLASVSKIHSSGATEISPGHPILYEENLLQIIAYICDIAGSPNTTDHHYNNASFRRATLQLLICALRLRVTPTSSWAPGIQTWIKSQMEEMVHGWNKQGQLSLVEASLIKELLTSALHLPNPFLCIDRSETPIEDLSSINAAFNALSDSSELPGTGLSASFWLIQDWLMETKRRTGSESSQVDLIVQVYRQSLSKLRARPGYPYLYPLATYVLEELALQTSLVRRLLPHEDIVAENQFLDSYLAILQSEAAAFRDAFPRIVSVPIFNDSRGTEAPRVTRKSPSLSVSPQMSPDPSANQSSTLQTDTPRSTSPVPTHSIQAPPISSQPTISGPVSKVPDKYEPQNEVNADQYPGPIELPTRKPTHRREQQTMRSFHIDTDPQVVENSQSDFEQGKEVSLSSPNFGQLSFHPTTDKRKSTLFGRFGRPAKISIPPLPESLEFCFSNEAQQIWLWCRKNPDSIVCMSHSFQEAQRFEVHIPGQLAPTSNKQLTCSIRLLAAARDSTIGVVHIAETRWLYIVHEKAFKPLIAIDNITPAIHCISLSHEGNMIALGCGQAVIVYKLDEARLTGPWKLYHNVDLRSRVARLQKVSFSPDSHRLVSAIQVEHSTHKHAVFVSVWACVGSDFRLEAQLDPVHVTVGYSDDTGITSISLTGHADLIASQQAFLTAALSKSYPSILPLAPGLRNQHLDIADKRIDNATQCSLSTSAHLIALRSGRNKIFLVDVRSGTMDKVADLSGERKGSQLRHEQVALGMPDVDSVQALWRSADENLILKTMVKGTDGKWTASPIELGPVYRQATGLL